MPVVMKVQKKSDCMTAILEVFRISGMLTSNLHICALTINQYIGIVYPLKYKVCGIITFICLFLDINDKRTS